MSDVPAERPRPSLWAVRGTAILLVAIGVFPLADRLGVADPQLWWPRAWHAWILWIPLVVLVALALARLAPRECEGVARRARRALLAVPPAGFAVVAALLTIALALWFGQLMFGSRPVTIDELSEQWQAHILASGRLFARAEPNGEFFSTMQTVALDGRWFAHFPIGGPAIQAIGQLLHVAWLMNPVLAGIAAAAFYRFAASVGDEAEARLATLLFATSPMVLVIAGSRLDHVATLAAIWIAIAALPGWFAASDSAAATRRSVVIGLALGCATIVRPYDGTIATLAIGVFQLWHARRGRRHARALAAQALAGALPIALLLVVNRALTGHPLTFAYDVLNGPDHRPGFHMSPLGYEHTPVTGLYRISSYVMRLNAMLLGWPVPAVLVVAIAMLLRRRATRWDVLLCGFVAATLGAYWLYWGDGSFHGPRFLYEVLPVFLLFAARFPRAVRDRVRRPVLRTAALLLVPLWLAAAWLLPSSRRQPFSAVNLTVKSREREVATARLVDAVHAARLTNALVFVDDGWHARLTARMRAIGIPPFRAQLLVGNYNACTLQQRLDDGDRRGQPGPAVARTLMAVMHEPLDAQPVPGLPALEQLALPATGAVPESCGWDYTHARGLGMDLARLLPLMPLDSLGRLAGDVVYARDFGARNDRLRERFGNRTWYTARPRLRHDTLDVVLARWDAPTPAADAPAGR